MLKRAARSRWFAALMGATLAVVVGGGSAVLANHQSDGAIHGCVKTRTGALRVVTSPSECDPKTETPIEWNRQGADGQDGAPGLPGNLALAGQQCPLGQAVSGFDADGNIVCTSTDNSDLDRDGYKAAGFPGGTDCNDNDATVKPGAAEVIGDGIDNNCDGIVDGHPQEGQVCEDGNPYTVGMVQQDGTCTQTWTHTDLDGDGWDTTWWDPAGDCDDGDAAINPGQAEVADGKDNNCNGVVDEMEP